MIFFLKEGLRKGWTQKEDLVIEKEGLKHPPFWQVSVK